MSLKVDEIHSLVAILPHTRKDFLQEQEFICLVITVLNVMALNMYLE